MTMRVAFIGCVESSKVALEALLRCSADRARVVAVLTRQSSTYNADFVDLTPLAQRHGVAVMHVEDAPTDEQQSAWLGSARPDLVVCVGWSRLLGAGVLKVAPRGVVGFHPAALPANRGRHPLIWALALGLDETASTFFLMQPEADSGPILNQRRIPIAPDDDAASLYAKVQAAIPRQIDEIVRGLADGSLTPTPQDDLLANNWRKRSAADGEVDWRMPAQGICNLVRALARPYPGAHFVHGGEPVKLWKCTPVEAGARNDEPGKVLVVEGRQLTVKCGVGAVRLVEHELGTMPTAGDYL